MDVKIEASTSDRLKQAMEMKNMKQADLVRATGIDKGSISLYVSGKYSPKGDKLYKLATALGVSSAWLSGFNVSINAFQINYIIMVWKSQQKFGLYQKKFGKSIDKLSLVC